MTAKHDYDLVVVGGGSAGLTASGMAAQLGAKTLLVERAKLGGDCTWHGCIPSKALLKAASVVHAARHASAYGLGTAELTVDLARVLAHVHDVQRHVYDDADSPEVIGGYGVTVRHASARFVDPHTIALSPGDGSSSRVTFRYAIVATGSRAVVPDVPGLDAVPYLTNETLFTQTTLPRRLVVLGGGPIGIEMAQAFSRLGSTVTVLERGAHVLPKDDPELTAVLRERLEAEGITIRTNARVDRVDGDGGAVRVTFAIDDAVHVVAADALLVAVGRRANTEGLGLELAGVTLDPKGAVQVDARGRTSQSHLYACGDVTGGYLFTHMAEHTAKVAVTNAILGVPSSIDDVSVPWVTFTDPELAHVGARARDLDARGTPYKRYRFPFSKIDRAVAQGVPHGWVHVLATPRTGKILGASILGESAGDMIAELALAQKHGISLRRLADTIHAYPTFALGNRRAADQWYIQKSSPTLVRALQRLRRLHGSVPPPPDPDRIV